MSVSPSRLTPADLPALFGRYELLEIIGQGGMGRVFRARLNGPAGFQKEVAVKVIIGGAETIPVHKRNQLAHEARLGALLRHPNIVDTYELGDNHEGMFIAMELIEGISLSKLIAREHGLPVACALDILLQVSAALDHAHHLNIEGKLTPMIHRDLKPGNLLVDRSSMVKITDFGISMLRMQGVAHLVPTKVEGTLRYMSPEQVTGAQLGVQSDLFSLGIVAYEMLSGNRLFPRAHPQETADKILLEEVYFKTSGRFKRMESLQPGLGSVVWNCLRRDPSDRIQSAAQLFEQLRALRMQSPGESLAQILPRHVAGARMLHMPLAPMGTETTAPSSPQTTTLSLSLSVSRNTNVPSISRTLHGREQLLKKIQRQFKKKARIVTLKGPGGIGKTSVAERYLTNQLEEQKIGAWIFDLTPARTIQDIIQIIAKNLDLPLGQGDLNACVQQIGRCLSGRGRAIYLLDNVEQISEHMKETLGVWMELAPQASFIATSRERLHLPDERVIEVDPLDEGEALALFRTRASQADGVKAPSKALSRKIIPHLEGNPLAIELAAARAQEMGAEALLQALSKRFAVLSSQGGRPNRQATLRATIDWSWNLLQPWEKSALSQLSIFRGGFTMEAANTVLGLHHQPNAPWVLDIIQSLLDNSLLRANTTADQPRFVLYESIRQYAGEKLDTDRKELEQRFIGHFASYGQPLKRRVLQSGGLPARQMLAELENLLHAFELAILNRDEKALFCFLAVYDAFERLGALSRIQDLSPKLLRLNLSPEDAAAVSLKTCFAHIVAGQLEQAKALIDTALKTAKDRQNEAQTGEAMFLLATVQLQQGLIQQSIATGTIAIERASEAKEFRMVALAQAIVGRAHRMAGQYSEANIAYKSATKISRHLDDKSLLAANLGNEGTIAMMEGRLTDAARLFGQSLSVAANTGDRRIQAARFFQLGTALLEAGELDSALADYHTAQRMFKDFGERFNEAMVLVGISQVHYIKANYSQARELLFESLSILTEVGSEAHTGITLANLGEVEIAMGEFVDAEIHLGEAIRVSEIAGMSRVQAAAHSARGLLYLRQDKHSKALVELEIAETSLRAINEPVELGKLLCNKSELHLALKKPEKAQGNYAEAHLLSKQLKSSNESELGRRLSALQKQLAKPS
jgi:serine/threonine protein kinase/tetratricopeptide (TPR) repeat protein